MMVMINDIIHFWQNVWKAIANLIAMFFRENDDDDDVPG